MEKEWSFQYVKPNRPDGPLIELSAAELEKHLLAQLNAPNADKTEGLWELARFYAETKKPEKAMDYLRQVLAMETEPEHKAHCVLAMGQTAERLRDYESAIRYYKEALAMEPAATRTWYLIHNNLGYCFNTLGRFAEGQVFCLKAIEIDAQRHNAHKNLGLALENQGMFAEAARCYVTATRLNASDRRAYDLLEKLLNAHPGLRIELGAETECCRKAVEFANNERLHAAPVLRRGWRKQLILLRLKVKSLFGKFLRLF